MPKTRKSPSRMDRKLAKPDTPKRPRERPLPGMEDGPIREIERHAAEYAEIRDRHQVLTKEETTWKAELLALMHKHQKTTYQRNGIKIWVEPGEESVKVRVKPVGDEDGAADEPANEEA